MIIKIDTKLGIKPIKTIRNGILFLRSQLIAPIKTKIIIEQKTKKSLAILLSKYLRKNLSNKIIKNGKRPI